MTTEETATPPAQVDAPKTVRGGHERFGRELLIGGAHLAALWAITFVQPLLDLLGSNPEFFVARGNGALDILTLAIGFTLIPPLVLLAVEWVTSRVSRRAYRCLHLGLIAILAAFFAVQVFKRTGIFGSFPTLIYVAIALALGALVAYGIARTRFVRGVFDVLSVAPIVILALFIFGSGTSKLVLPQSEARALGGDVQGNTPVVFAIFDELPAATLMDDNGDIDRSRFPGFGELADDATWYPNATTVADFTGRAVPGILTGIVTEGEKLPIAADQPQSLFTLLGGAYDLHVKESVTQLCPDSLCGDADEAGPGISSRLKALFDDLKYVEGRLVLPPSLEERLPDVSTTFGDFGMAEGLPEDKRAGEFVRDLFSPPSPEEMSQFIEDIPRHGRTLSTIHMEVPHEPFQFLPDGTTYNATDVSNMNGPGAQMWAVGQAGISSVEQRHYIQTGYADTLIGTMVDQLKQLGIWDQAMVVVTADHGISFKPGEPRRIVVPENLAGVANVPLFIKYPDQERGSTDQQHVRTIDIVPTIAEELGMTDMYATDGSPISADASGGEIEILNGLGDTVVATIDEVIEQRREVLRSSWDSLGRGGLFSLGPAPDLIGQQAPPAFGDRISLFTPGIFEDVDLGREPLPVFVAGHVEGVDQRTLLAVAVNGQVVATTRAFIFEDEMRFGVIVPPTSLVSGRNEIAVYEVSEAGSLLPLGGN